MAVDFEKEDKAEEITRLENSNLLKYALSIAVILFAAYLVARLLHWIFGFPSSLTELNYGFASFFGLMYSACLLELLGNRLREIRNRSKETNNRLTEIEKQIETQAKQISGRLSAIESNLSDRTDSN